MQETVLTNRSRYNRAGVERVMKFCAENQVEEFFESAIQFESMISASDIQLVKYYLGISKGEQRKRLADREVVPLKQWKTSPTHAVALKHWDEYTRAPDEMLERTHHARGPWYIVRADKKKAARLEVIRHLLSRVDCPDKKEQAVIADPAVIFEFSPKTMRK